MQKTLITTATVFTLVMSAGASMAGPLNGHSFGGKAHDVRSTVSQALNSAGQMAHTLQITKGSTDLAVGEQPTTLSSTPAEDYVWHAIEDQFDSSGLVWFDLQMVNYPYPANFFKNLPVSPRFDEIVNH
ncbi:outer membrane autotransporter [Phaeobacter inhibens]|uniref:Outer membrane autotransporter n=1 Tax=Phaeobacter inhibens TaxID=221822 RepID=A0ABM6RBV4_9RHOB|nr:hypothetical protein [Phaeobacter inhibens]AUQ49295.1 outer membrane autotransporter [Phaeobacter inhibens]AUQ93795.1 outer membrane autotransporter [Phaeobacter inhibens]AUR19098.1 outer membrane autotransporter [Phaeobacter inhibens]UWR91229.1 hypothetical protein K4K96_10940 [Phaeobacter inhibens]